MKWVGTWHSAVPGAPEVSGTLEQADDGVFTLQTYEGLATVVGGADHDDIVGVANGRKITILDARLWHYEGGVGGGDSEAMRKSMREQYRSRLVIIGTHEPAATRFVNLAVTSEFLDAWIDTKLWDYKIVEHRLDLHYNDLTAPFAFAAGAELYLSTGTHTELGQKRWSITRNTTFHLNRTTAEPLQPWIDDVQHLDSLMDAVFGQPTAATTVRLTPPDDPRRFDSVQVAGTFAEPRFAEPPHWPLAHDALFPFAEGGGQAAIAKWFGLNVGFRHVAARVTSHYRGEGRFLEDRALAAFAAGEAIDRLETGHANSTARTRWRRLTAAVPEFQEVVGGMQVDRWIDLLVTDRDDLAHALSLGEHPKQQARVRALMDSAHLLSVLSLLRIAGMTDALTAVPSTHAWARSRNSFGHGMRAAGELG
jgi:ApeA N-terminal domain 1